MDIFSAFHLYSKFIILGFYALLFWVLANFIILICKWIQSYLLKIDKNTKSFSIDLRKNKNIPTKVLIFSAIKAQPEKQVWFGHIWIVWPEAPPLAKGETEAGFYAANKLNAAVSLIYSVISPISFFIGQKPINGIMKDDKGLYRHWQLLVLVDENQYLSAIEIDNKWRNQSNYILRPKLGGKTITCRDYVFEVATAIGLKAKFNNWAQFPAQSFIDFLKLNKIKQNNIQTNCQNLHSLELMNANFL